MDGTGPGRGLLWGGACGRAWLQGGGSPGRGCGRRQAGPSRALRGLSPPRGAPLGIQSEEAAPAGRAGSALRVARPHRSIPRAWVVAPSRGGSTPDSAQCAGPAPAVAAGAAEDRGAGGCLGPPSHGGSRACAQAGPGAGAGGGERRRERHPGRKPVRPLAEAARAGGHLGDGCGGRWGSGRPKPLRSLEGATPLLHPFWPGPRALERNPDSLRASLAEPPPQAPGTSHWPPGDVLSALKPALNPSALPLGALRSPSPQSGPVLPLGWAVGRA